MGDAITLASPLKPPPESAPNKQSADGIKLSVRGEVPCSGSNWTTRRVIGVQTVVRVHPTPIAGSDIPAAQTKFNDQLKQQPYRGNSDSAKEGEPT